MRNPYVVMPTSSCVRGMYSLKFFSPEELAALFLSMVFHGDVPGAVKTFQLGDDYDFSEVGARKTIFLSGMLSASLFAFVCSCIDTGLFGMLTGYFLQHLGEPRGKTGDIEAGQQLAVYDRNGLEKVMHGNSSVKAVMVPFEEDMPGCLTDYAKILRPEEIVLLQCMSSNLHFICENIPDAETAMAVLSEEMDNMVSRYSEFEMGLLQERRGRRLLDICDAILIKYLIRETGNRDFSGILRRIKNDS